MAQNNRLANVCALLIINAVPIVGVLYFDWQPVKLVFFYWLETWLVGGASVLRILSTQDKQRLMLAMVFCGAFGLFCFAQGFFLFHFFKESLQLSAVSPDRILPEALNVVRVFSLEKALLLVVLMQVLWLIKDVATHQLGTANEELNKPFKRVGVQQFSIIAFAFAAQLIPQSGFLMMVIMAGVKLYQDLTSLKYTDQQDRH